MPATPKISRGVRMLPPKPKESSSQEMQAFQNDIHEIEQWWKNSRWEHTTRTYKGTLDWTLYFLCLLCLVCYTVLWIYVLFLYQTCWLFLNVKIIFHRSYANITSSSHIEHTILSLTHSLTHKHSSSIKPTFYSLSLERRIPPPIPPRTLQHQTNIKLPLLNTAHTPIPQSILFQPSLSQTILPPILTLQP